MSVCDTLQHAPARLKTVFDFETLEAIFCSQSALRIATSNELLYHEERECGCAKFKRESKTHTDVHCNADIITVHRLQSVIVIGENIRRSCKS